MTRDALEVADALDELVIYAHAKSQDTLFQAVTVIRELVAKSLVDDGLRPALDAAVVERDALRAELAEAREALDDIFATIAPNAIDGDRYTPAELATRVAEVIESDGEEMAEARAKLERHREMEAALVERARRVDAENSALRAELERVTAALTREGDRFLEPVANGACEEDGDG